MSKKNREKRINSKSEALSPKQIQNSESVIFNLKSLIALLVVIIAPIATYWNSLEGEFHFDDYHAIVENPNIKSFDRAVGLHTRFVTDVSLAIDYSLGKLDTRYYHAQQIFWHTANCVLIFFILLLTLKRINLKPSSFIPFATALLFAVHPLNSEPVNYLIQRSMVLGTFFYLASLLFFILNFGDWNLLGILNLGFRIFTSFGCLLCFILAIFTKETFATLPIALLFYYIYFIKPSDISAFAIIKKLGVKFWVVVITFSLLVFSWMAYLGIFKAIARGIYSFDIFTNSLLTQLKVAIEYIGLALLPLPSRLNIDHFYGETQFAIMNIAAIVIIGGLLYTIIKTHKKYPLLSYAILWIFLTHVPTSVVPRGELLVEYRNYLPMFGFLTASSYLLYKSIQWFMIEKGLYILIFVVAIPLSILTAQRNKVWESDIMLWQDSLNKSPNNPRAICNLVTSYGVKGDSENVINWGRKALEIGNITPENLVRIYSDLGTAYIRKGNLGEAERYLLKGSDVNTSEHDKAVLYGNLGILYAQKNKYEKAILYYEMAIKAKPYNSRTYANCGSTYLVMHEYKKAKAMLEKALELDPDNKLALEQLKECKIEMTSPNK